MFRSRRKKWLQSVAAWASVPVFVALALLSPDPNREAKEAFPVERLEAGLSALGIDDVVTVPEEKWQKHTDHALAIDGFGVRTAWFRVKIPAAQTIQDQRELVASVGFYPLGAVDFYLREDGKAIASLLTGIDRTLGSHEDPGIYYSFPFSEVMGKARWLYVKLAAQGFFVTEISVRDRAGFTSLMEQSELLLSGAIGIVFGLLLFNTVLYAALRKGTYVYNVLFQIAVLMFALIGSGCFTAIFSSVKFDYGTMVRLLAQIFMVVVVTQTMFLSSLIKMQKMRPKLDSIAFVARVGAILTLVAAPLLPLGILISSSLFYLVVTIFQYNTFKSFRSNLRSIHFYNLAIRGAAVAGIISVGSWAGYYPSHVVNDHLYLGGLMWGGLFLSLSVASRVRELTQGNRDAVETIRNRGPKSRLNAILRDDFRDKDNTSDMMVTIMFIDIVSFGQIADAMDSQLVLTKLTKRLDEITKIIHTFGGTVDRSVGDGIICFFGYGAGRSSSRHVLDAFQAAVKIQQDTVDAASRIFELYGEGASDFPLPVRIGMHTDQVTIGNLGNEQSVDFTIVGSGVNFAGQLEAACAPFKIMLSESSRQHLLMEGAQSDDFQPILFPAKNMNDLVRGYEANPFANDPHRLNVSTQMYRKKIGSHERQDRVRLGGGPEIILQGGSGSFRVIDFSPGGFQCVGATFLAQKSIVELRVETQNSRLNQELEDKILRDLSIEVRWSRRAGREFLHGMKIIGANEKQLELLGAVLRQAGAELKRSAGTEGSAA